MDIAAIDAWSTYLSVEAEVGATLTGLVFVAVSINLSRVLSTIGLPGRALESILQLFGVVLISTTVLVPRQALSVLGTEVLVLGVLLWLAQTAIQIRYLTSKTGHPRYRATTRMALTQLAAVPFCVSGILLLCGSGAGMYWLAPGCFFSLLAGVANAWVLLVEILR